MRYYLFAGRHHDEVGGMRDMQGEFPDLAFAKKRVADNRATEYLGWEWAEIWLVTEDGLKPVCSCDNSDWDDKAPEWVSGVGR